MMKLKFIIFIPILSLFFCCDSQEKTDIITSDFNQFENLESIQTYNIEFYNTARILICDTLLITQENTTSSYFYNVYNLNSSDSISSFLALGRSGDEVTQALNVDYYIGDTIQVYSFPNRVSLYSMKDIVSGDTKKVKKIDLQKMSIDPFTSMHLIDGTDFIACAENIEIDSNARFCRYNSETEQATYFGEYPITDVKLKEFPIENSYRLYAYQGKIYIKSDKCKALFVRSSGIGFDILDITNNKIVSSKNYEYPDYYMEYISQLGINMSKESDDNISIRASAYSDNYFYLAYSNIEITPNGIKKSTDEIKSYIFSFDWDGNPVKGYVINDVISAVGLDVKNNFLYAITIDADKNSILKKYKI